MDCSGPSPPYEFENYLLAALSLAFTNAAFPAGAKAYQITRTAVEATGSKVTVEKGGERFEMDIDPATTKGTAELKVGSTVTYVMSATKIEASAAPNSASAL